MSATMYVHSLVNLGEELTQLLEDISSYLHDMTLARKAKGNDQKSKEHEHYTNWLKMRETAMNSFCSTYLNANNAGQNETLKENICYKKTVIDI